MNYAEKTQKGSAHFSSEQVFELARKEGQSVYTIM